MQGRKHPECLVKHAFNGVTAAIFVTFRRFPGSEEQSPYFRWVECKFVIFAVFVKTPLLAGDKNTVCQKHGFCHPETWSWRMCKYRMRFAEL